MSPSIFLFIMLLFWPHTLASQHVKSEQAILLSIKKQWGNPQPLSTWQPATSPCSWHGIECSATKEIITGVRLPNATIFSQIPSSICLLRNLTTLDLSWNYIPYGFPTMLYKCSSLNHLDLSMNCFVGPIPEDIYKLSSLRYLDISSNNFTGNVPKSIGLLSQLATLHLNDNLLDGTFPPEIANLSNLEILRMWWNPFTPMAIPSDWGRLKKVKQLFLTNCNIVGEIPASIGAMESLQHLDLAKNQLVGSIPATLFMLKELKYMILHDNNLSGAIPTPVGSSSLLEFDVCNNNLSGPIPEQIGNWTRLQTLSIFNNKLTGGVPSRIGLLPKLMIIKLFQNNLSGILPPELGLHSPLNILEVFENSLSGALPQHLCFRGKLKGLTAFSNKLSGKIPRSLENCSALLILMLHNNNLTGEIHSGIWTSPNLNNLILSNNDFTGQLPPRVSGNLARIKIDNNKFGGEIPTSIGCWKNIEVFEAGNNMLSGSLPLGLTSLSRLNTLSLEGNELSGKLPTEITSWSNLEKLDLSHNKFSGPLPGSFGSFPSLDYLDLAGNHLSGLIPPQFEHNILTFLNLSDNGLFGQIPSVYNNKAFATSFLNNALCTQEKSRISRLPQCSTSSTSPPPSSPSFNHFTKKYLAIILVTIGILFFLTLYWTFYTISRMRRLENYKEPVLWSMTSFERLKFSETNIISNLLEDNVVGSGGSGKIYKVQLDNLDFSVAVKQMWNSENIDNGHFLAEVKILGTIRHRNIVKLLCCITSYNSKLLVYEYLENQGLDRWLYGRTRLGLEGGDTQRVLEWSTRLKIAIGAAQGLCYMHHDCFPPIIHRDIKSSNILLDSEFNAKIADFGIAKMLMREGELQTMSNIAGSFGYMAPEYEYTIRVSEKIDVYSFGVVLLELATGKEPNNREENMNLAEWSRKYYKEKKPIEDALDVEVVEDNCIEEMLIVFKLGLRCTSLTPSLRPSMKDVLQMLHQLNPPRRTHQDNHDVPPFLPEADHTHEDVIQMV